MNKDLEQQEIDPSWQELMNAFANGLIEEPKKIIFEYRFYYDENGNITQVSSNNWNHPETGNYVVVDQAMHDDWMKYYVKNGRAEIRPTEPTSQVQLTKSDTGYEVVENNPALLLEPNEKLPNTEYYDSRNR